MRLSQIPLLGSLKHSLKMKDRRCHLESRTSRIFHSCQNRKSSFIEQNRQTRARVLSTAFYIAINMQNDSVYYANLLVFGLVPCRIVHPPFTQHLLILMLFLNYSINTNMLTNNFLKIFFRTQHFFF